jgi:hypothetical protein
MRRSSRPLVTRRTADLLRDVVLYTSTAVCAGVVGWLLVLLTGATAS